MCKSAFPHEDGQFEGENDAGSHGMTMREYYAAHAPEMPDWFQCGQPYELPKQPSAVDVEGEEDREIVRAWLNDDVWDLPENLKWFADKMVEWRAASHKHRLDCAEARFFAWRRHYADMMIKTMETNNEPSI